VVAPPLPFQQVLDEAPKQPGTPAWPGLTLRHQPAQDPEVVGVADQVEKGAVAQSLPGGRGQLGAQVPAQEVSHTAVVQALDVHLGKTQGLAVVAAAAGEDQAISGPSSDEAAPGTDASPIIGRITEGHLVERVHQQEEAAGAQPLLQIVGPDPLAPDRRDEFERNRIVPIVRERQEQRQAPIPGLEPLPRKVDQQAVQGRRLARARLAQEDPGVVPCNRLGNVLQRYPLDATLGALPAGLQGGELGLDAAPAGRCLALGQGPGQRHISACPAVITGVDEKGTEILFRVRSPGSRGEQGLRGLRREQHRCAVGIGQTQQLRVHLGLQLGIGAGEKRSQLGQDELDLLGAEVADQVDLVPPDEVPSAGPDSAGRSATAGVYARRHLDRPCLGCPRPCPVGRTGGVSVSGRPPQGGRGPDRTGLACFRGAVPQSLDRRIYRPSKPAMDNTTRKPKLLLKLSG
jgi:hypothetical protein